MKRKQIVAALPATVSELAAKFQLERLTAKKALYRLKLEGKIVTTTKCNRQNVYEAASSAITAPPAVVVKKAPKPRTERGIHWKTKLNGEFLLQEQWEEVRAKLGFYGWWSSTKPSEIDVKGITLACLRSGFSKDEARTVVHIWHRNHKLRFKVREWESKTLPGVRQDMRAGCV